MPNWCAPTTISDPATPFTSPTAITETPKDSPASGALASGLGLLPLALSAGAPGSEIQAPMAVVILCGLGTSTLLNMLVVPALYLRFGAVTTALRQADAGS